MMNTTTDSSTTIKVAENNDTITLNTGFSENISNIAISGVTDTTSTGGCAEMQSEKEEVYEDDNDNVDVSVAERMVHACESNDFDTVKDIVQKHGIMYGCYAIPSTGITPLMMASSMGHVELVQYLLHICGAPWNALDRNNYKCAGDYATQSQHWEIVNILVDWATTAELILGAVERAKRQNDDDNNNKTYDMIVGIPTDCSNASSTKPDYLRQRLQYTHDGNALIDADKDAVMMEWERPIMKAHAELLMTQSSTSILTRKRVLNVGFGMGIIDTILQEEHQPIQHIIIEAHPDVYAHMVQKGWDTKPNVRICYGTWQSVLPQLKNEGCIVDAIFFDTYGEHYIDMEDFHSQMIHILAKPHGIYSFFNGLAPDNLFFHGVACQCIKLQLASLGLDSEFVNCEIQVPHDDVWDNIRRKYWHGRDVYYLPICTWNHRYITTNVLPPEANVYTSPQQHKRKYDASISATTTGTAESTSINDEGGTDMETEDITLLSNGNTGSHINNDVITVPSKRLQS